VFVVASARDGFDPAEVLFERGSMRRNTPPRRTARKDVAGPITAGISKGLRGTEGIESNWAVTTYSTPAIGHVVQDDIASTVTKNTGGGGETQNPAYVAQPMAYASSDGIVRPLNDVMSTLDSAGESRGTNQQRFVQQEMSVRRLTPRECERLQGFPDDYTAIPNGADGPRYKALGNSMAVPVMHWIGKKISKEMQKNNVDAVDIVE
jgi:DNA (cytosine-5)-methyltransferase 1